MAVYPIGGGTSLDFGLPPRAEGIGVSLAKLNQIVDYPAEDMTITVGAGITISQLGEILAQHRQRLAIDVPQADTATLGGVIATNFSGPRRFGCGTMRDYVIGIEAVDARGERFKGGGRVVKNVAGYDLCRLLVGSLGTLGIITQVTLKLQPLVAESQVLACGIRDWNHAERLLAALVESETTPTAIELIAGPEWAGLVEQQATLLVGLEGTVKEVAWMQETLVAEWQALDTPVAGHFLGTDATELWTRLTEFPALPAAAVTLKATTVPSAVTTFAALARALQPSCSLQSHAGNGVTIVRLADYPAAGLSRTLLAQLVPLAAKSRGNVTILSNPSGAEMTKQSVWGGIDAPYDLMTEIKRQFDPRDTLNPGRFVYA
jgi:glycolate oxidase FAD binding subunit